MSKGSVPRPFSVDAETFADRWEQTFGKPAKVGGFPEIGGEPIKPGDAFQFYEDPESHE